MAEQRSLLTAMREKDPELYGRVEHLPSHKVLEAWRSVYPEDMPEGDNTLLDDYAAIKPKPAQQ